MNQPGKEYLNITNQKVESKEGQRTFLSSDKSDDRCPSLGFNSELMSEDIALDYLASILVDIFLESKKNEHNKQKGS